MFGMCLGYPDNDSGKKTRLPLDVIFKTDEYTTEGDVERLEEYDSYIKEYYTQRTAGRRVDTWTNQISNLMSNPQRPHMREFLEKQGFKMK
ncbi:hypothetical protein [Clostridium sp. DJ247]|uniref:hypothetical protein n=1 Tax=Clostridium sp. DJ247 TaxID=2726188 RepID=UPI001F4D19E3|nr:hypothetical protein [Clostridium sp. DJ247]